jgi:phospholipid/cholesterol/gamma-HCH transport system permease protein
MFSVVALLTASIRRALFTLDGAGRSVVFRVTNRQILFTGFDAITLVALLGATVGILVIVQSAWALPDIGLAESMGKLLVLIILKELGPVMVAFVVAARSGTAIAAELATMKVRGEIDGLTGVGVDPLVYLVFPRVVGVAVAVVSLTVVFTTAAFVAGFGFAAASRATLTLESLFSTLFRALRWQDVVLMITKSATMGVAIAGICAARGMSAGTSSTDVPVAALRAVVSTLFWCLFIEVVLTALFIDFGSIT